MNKTVCGSCIFCSFEYPSNKILCDKDNHEIKNETTESCSQFQVIEDDVITCTQCGAEIPYVSGCVICPVCGAKHCGE